MKTRFDNILPLGCIVGIGRIKEIERAEDIKPWLTQNEVCFGDYSYGRWAWEFTDTVSLLYAPIPHRGSLGIWRLRGPFAKLLAAGRAITLTQPWATLLACGKKGWETRSWKTARRERVAIHSSKEFPKWCRELCEREPFKSALENIIKGPK
jgi:hypothetical protein